MQVVNCEDGYQKMIGECVEEWIKEEMAKRQGEREGTKLKKNIFNKEKSKKVKPIDMDVNFDVLKKYKKVIDDKI